MFSKGVFKSIATVIISSCITAISLAVFIIPNNIMPGGLSGMSAVLGNMFWVKTSMVYIIVCLLTGVLGILFLGAKSIVKAIAISLSTSVLLILFENIGFQYTENILFASIISGIMIGLATAAALLDNTTTGGTDTIGMILQKKWPHLSVSNLMTWVNALIIVLGVIVTKNVDVAIYSAICIFAIAKTVDIIQQGFDYAKLFYVITDNVNAQNLIDALTLEGDLGVTVLSGNGGYTKADRVVLLVATKRNKAPFVMQTVARVDQSAFVIVQDATEVRGSGFARIMD